MLIKKIPIFIFKILSTFVALSTICICGNDLFTNVKLYNFYKEFCEIAVNTIHFYPKCYEDLDSLTAYLNLQKELEYGIYSDDYNYSYGQIFISKDGNEISVKAEKMSSGYKFIYDKTKVSCNDSQVLFWDDIYGEFSVPYVSFDRLFKNNSSELIPIIVGGKRFEKFEIGNKLKVGFAENVNGNSNYSLFDCIVVDKLNAPFSPINGYKTNFYSTAKESADSIVYMPFYTAPSYNPKLHSQYITFKNININEIISDVSTFGYVERASYAEDITEKMQIAFRFAVMETFAVIVSLLYFVAICILSFRRLKCDDRFVAIKIILIIVIFDIICWVAANQIIESIYFDTYVGTNFLNPLLCVFLIILIDILIYTICNYLRGGKND